MGSSLISGFSVAVLLSWNSVATLLADEKATPPAAAAATDTVAESAPSASTGRRFAVILCGHPGDNDHIALFQSSVEKIHNGLAAHYQFKPEHIRVFSGDNSPDDADLNNTAVEPSSVPDPAGESAAAVTFPIQPATREIIVSELEKLKGEITPDDSLFVIVIGHTHFDNNLAWFNLHGPDVQQKQFADLFVGFLAREQVFFITIPCSGYYIRTLSGPGRYIISATESDLEINETLCPHVLAGMFSTAPMADWDLDSDKQISLFEFYIALCRGVADRYIDETLISTEHALLDDNADGKGSELQQHYLTEDQGGLPTNRQRKKLTEGRDGMAASKLPFTSL